MIEAHLRDDHYVLVVFQTSHGLLCEISIRLVSPSQIERSTGTLRSPESTVDLPADLASQLVEPVLIPAGPLIGLVVHTVSRRATAVGVFATEESAGTWWAQPYNRLAHNTDVLFLLAPIVDGV